MNFELLQDFMADQDFMAVLVTCKSEEDPIKKEGARELTFSPI